LQSDTLSQFATICQSRSIDHRACPQRLDQPPHGAEWPAYAVTGSPEPQAQVWYSSCLGTTEDVSILIRQRYLGIVENRTMSSSKTRLILLLLCMTMVTALLCPGHTAPPVPDPTAPFEHHHGSLPHAIAHVFCPLAVLPADALLRVFSLALRIALDALLLASAAFVFLPFIPPRLLPVGCARLECALAS
jgi:hypothetical protein